MARMLLSQKSSLGGSESLLATRHSMYQNTAIMFYYTYEYVESSLVNTEPEY